MKILAVTIGAIGLLLGSSCEKRALNAAPGNADNSTAQTEAQLIENRNQLELVLSAQRKRMDEIRGEIAHAQDALSEIKPKIEKLDAVKKQMTADIIRLKERWESEMEGIQEAPGRPFHEILHEMSRKMEQLLQENEDLKRKLGAGAR